VASRRPQRLPLVASMRRSTSASVRCSRRRSSALGRRLGSAPAKPRWCGNNVRDVRQVGRRAIELADDGAEQITQLVQPPIGALLLGDDPINAGPELLLAHPPGTRCLLDLAAKVAAVALGLNAKLTSPQQLRAAWRCWRRCGAASSRVSSSPRNVPVRFSHPVGVAGRRGLPEPHSVGHGAPLSIQSAKAFTKAS
jgi:hypothetical protein